MLRECKVNIGGYGSEKPPVLCLFHQWYINDKNRVYAIVESESGKCASVPIEDISFDVSELSNGVVNDESN